MALLFMDSFDHYATADLLDKWTTAGAAVAITATGRHSSNALKFNSSGQECNKSVTPSSTILCGFALKVSAAVTILDLGEPGAMHLLLAVKSDGALAVARCAGGNFLYLGHGAETLLGTTAAGQVAMGTYTHVQIKATIHDSAGTVELRVNGSPTAALALTGLDTRNGSTGLVSQVIFGSHFSAVEVDDLYVLDATGPAPLNDFLGDCRVDARYPTAEGAASAWTPLAGTDNALMVDETAPDDDTTYNSAAAAGVTDTHVVEDAPVVGATLFGVQVVVSAKKTDAGTCTIAPVVRHGTTNYPGTAFNPGTTYGYAVTPYGTNPGTSAAWTEADFNAAQFGYTRTA